MKKIILSAIAALFVAGTSMAAIQEKPGDSKTPVKQEKKDMHPQTNPSAKKKIKVKKNMQVKSTAVQKKKEM